MRLQEEIKANISAKEKRNQKIVKLSESVQGAGKWTIRGKKET